MLFFEVVERSRTGAIVEDISVTKDGTRDVGRDLELKMELEM